MPGPVALLDDLIERGDAPEQSLVVANRTELDPVQRLFEQSFAGQPVAVVEEEIPAEADDLVLLVREGEVVASSALRDVMDACLLVNSDLYRTGLSGIEKYEAPDVVTDLDETVFRLRGFPASNREKLLLIVVSRFIEGLALDHDGGTLRTTFQRLSRMDRELGTRKVYDRLAASGVDVHVYGMADWEPPADWSVGVHTGDHEGYRESWCVVFRPPSDDDRHAALVALETGPNEWKGTWTYDPDRVARTERLLVEEF